MQPVAHLQQGREGIVAAPEPVGLGEGFERGARAGEAARRQELEVIERRCDLRQRVPGVLLHAVRQIGRRRGLDVRPRAHGGVLVRTMDVEEMADVAEGVRERDRRGGRIDLEGEGGDLLPAILPRLQAQHHQAALRGLLVAEVGKMLDQEPPRRVSAHGASSTS